MTVAHVVERSGVSRRTFYEVFDDREDCFLAAFEQALSYVSDRVLPAFAAERGWREGVRAGLVALLGLFDREPAIAQILIVESLTGGPRTLERRGEVVQALTELVSAGASEARASTAVASLPVTAEGVVGGVLSVISSRLTDGDVPLVELTGALMSMIVLPYLGPVAARRELERPGPTRPAVSGGDDAGRLLTDPFKDTGLRLTYRTVRVLVAIADRPGASNRQVADAVEIKDQGQISKLLTRLQRAGMVTNKGFTQGKGAPNSWELTDTGGRVVATISLDALRTRVEK